VKTIGALAAATLAAVSLPVAHAAAAPAQARASVTCSKHGLAAARGSAALKVVRIRAAGVRCAVAARAAAQVARQLERGGSVSVPGSDSVQISSVSCTGCRPRVDVLIGYPSGTVHVTLAGTAAPSALPPPLPPVDPFAPPAPGSGTVI
jgi:hypothetical protein